MAVPEGRIRAVGDRPLRPDRELVLYWMVAARRPSWNFALDRAVEHARALRKPLVVLEPLRVAYDHASDRLHRFVVDGMASNAAAFERAGVGYYPYVEPEPGAGKGLLAAFAARACVVVTDDSPAFFLPRMITAAAQAIDVRLEAVDGNGLLPMSAASRVFPTAFAFRAFLQRELPQHLACTPRSRPFARAALAPAPPWSREITRRWPRASPALLSGSPEALAALPIDHEVRPAPVAGGCDAAREVLRSFVGDRLAGYAEDRNHPDLDASSGLSPWLHFGHLSPHEVFAAVADEERWDLERIGARSSGQREGWWGMSASAEAFLDQLVTWRELGLNMCSKRADASAYESLPQWARETLEKHQADPREAVYPLAALEAAATGDPIWNAAQRQLLAEGRIHNALRMLWGKKVIGWSRTPREALATLFQLNDRYALDGRDPNSITGICWCFGRYDRPWGPERPVFGTVRYMTSENSARKWRMKRYLERWSGGEGPAQQSLL